MQTVDVVVVGAGPAGASAATVLARRGLEVALVDRATFPRDKVCGDGLTSLALGLLEDLGVEPAALGTWHWAGDCWVRSPSGWTARFPLPRGQGHFAAVATRTELDAALVDLARKAGAVVLEGQPVVHAEQDDTEVQVRLADDAVLRARWAVAADGTWSPMRKLLGVTDGRQLGEWHAFRQYAGGVGGVASTDLYVAFEADLVPGYFWAFPLADGRANVGFGVQHGGRVPVATMGRVFRDLLERPHVREALGPDARLEGDVRAWPIPARVDRAVSSAGRTLFAGDALAACDVMTGEGIGQALLTGMGAAGWIHEQGHEGTTAARSYDAWVRRQLVADHRMSTLLVRALRHRKGARAAVRVAGANRRTRERFARWLFEDYPRALVATPRRWRLGAMSGVGAWTGQLPHPAAPGPVPVSPSSHGSS